MKRIVVLGSTGSIGTQTLEVVREQEGLKVVGLAAGSNVSLMEKQIREFMPSFAVMWSEEAAKELKLKIADLDVKVLSGMEGLVEIASMEAYDVLVTAIVGMIGIRPTIAAIKAGKDIALANKETLVTAGHIIMPLAAEKGVSILPVDSEHSAIFQSMNGDAKERISKIWLTASGGPFFGRKREELEHVTLEQALKHPNWSMGAKITVDSATLMNKGLEFIEAMHLYQMPPEKISIVVHRESIIHSLVEYCDNAVIAQLGSPDMRLPIQYALTWPARIEGPAAPLDLLTCGALTFAQPDPEAFPCLALALKAAEMGGTAGAILNGANEAAVGKFLNKEIGFMEISRRVARAMEQVPLVYNPGLEEILQADQAARAAALA